MPLLSEKEVPAIPMSDLALQLIADNKRTKAKSLDLGRCGLNAVPTEIRELVWLESLFLADEWS